MPSSVTITLLWCFGRGACCLPHHCASHAPHFGQWMLLSGSHVASHSPHAIHFSSHSTLLLPSKCLQLTDSTSKLFGKSPVHTQVKSINHHHQSAFQHLTSHHMAQWVSNVDVTLATHHTTITTTCFPTTNTASVVMVCVVGLDKVQCMMVTDDSEVNAIHRVTQLVWCANTWPCTPSLQWCVCVVAWQAP